MRMITAFLVLTFCSELLSFILLKQEEYRLRYSVYHVYNIVQLLLISLFFVYAIKPYRYRRFIILSLFLSPLVGVANMLFLQPINSINSNMLMFESFVITSLSLYLLYHRVKNYKHTNIFKNTDTQIALVLLLSWSTTFFFWAFIEILYDSDWKYSSTIINTHIIINILVYASIAAVFYFYPKKTCSS